MRRKVLIVDDLAPVRAGLAREFEAEGWKAFTAESFVAALALLDTHRFKLAIVDLQMPEHSGLELLWELSLREVSFPTVLMSGYASVASAVAAMKLGAQHVLTKPVRARDVLSALGHTSHLAGDPPLPSLARTEWEHLQRALSDTGGNLSSAARSLGIARRTLQRKLRKRPPRV